MLKLEETWKTGSTLSNKHNVVKGLMNQWLMNQQYQVVGQTVSKYSRAFSLCLVSVERVRGEKKKKKKECVAAQNISTPSHKSATKQTDESIEINICCVLTYGHS